MKSHALAFAAVMTLVAAGGFLHGCDDTSKGSSEGDGGLDGGAASGGGSGGAGTGSGGTGTGLVGGGTAAVSCATGVSQCSDGQDNDGDGKTDMADPECVSPCDNDEGSFATGIEGDNIDACKQDCFFDGDSGQGNDGCEWNLKCDPKNPGATATKPCPYDEGYKNCPAQQSERCIKNCGSVTPNGCDCFGCCAFEHNNSTLTVVLTKSCSQATLGDATACPRCTQQTQCVNTCEKCEICLGKTVLPDECVMTPVDDAGAPVPVPDGGMAAPKPSCAAGLISCGPNGDVADGACPAGTYCLTGCCILPLL
jgi:hypothetical protein